MHKTSYTGREAVSIGHNQAWLEPRSISGQQVESFSLRIEPEPSIRSRQTDYFGNSVTLFSFNEGYQKLDVTATSFVTVLDQSSATEAPLAGKPWEQAAELLRTHGEECVLRAYEFVFSSPRVNWNAEMKAYAVQSFPAGRCLLDGIRELTQRIHTDFAYDPRATTVTTPVQDAFRIRRGVCQDFAHIEIAMLRSLGLAARYVSGYLRTYPPEGQPRLVGADASHAWLSIYCGGEIWVDVDPTNNKFASTDHITLAWGRDYGDVPPLSGVFIGGGQHRLTVSVDVLPLPGKDVIRPKS